MSSTTNVTRKEAEKTLSEALTVFQKSVPSQSTLYSAPDNPTTIKEHLNHIHRMEDALQRAVTAITNYRSSSGSASSSGVLNDEKDSTIVALSKEIDATLERWADVKDKWTNALATKLCSPLMELANRTSDLMRQSAQSASSDELRASSNTSLAQFLASSMEFEQWLKPLESLVSHLGTDSEGRRTYEQLMGLSAEIQELRDKASRNTTDGGTRNGTSEG